MSTSLGTPRQAVSSEKDTTITHTLLVNLTSNKYKFQVSDGQRLIRCNRRGRGSNLESNTGTVTALDFFFRSRTTNPARIPSVSQEKKLASLLRMCSCHPHADVKYWSSVPDVHFVAELKGHRFLLLHKLVQRLRK